MSDARIFRYFKTSPEVIRLAVMMDVRYPLSPRNVEDLLHERGMDITHETVRFWWNRSARFSRPNNSRIVLVGGDPLGHDAALWHLWPFYIGRISRNRSRAIFSI